MGAGAGRGRQRTAQVSVCCVCLAALSVYFVLCLVLCAHQCVVCALFAVL